MNLILELLTLKDEIGELKRMMFSYVEDNYKPNVEEIKLQREMELQEEVEKIRVDTLNEHIFTGYKLNLQKEEVRRIKEAIKAHPCTMGGYRKRQADALGFSIDKYYKKLKKYNLYEQ